MSSDTASYRQYRAPSDNDTALVDPPWSEQLAQLRDGTKVDVGTTLGGVALAELIPAARRALIEAALAHTSEYLPVDSTTAQRVVDGAPLVLSGHQPELYHPGVWFKNFALSSLAEATEGVAVSLQVDSDLCRTTSLRAPTGRGDAVRVTSVAYDEPLAVTPHEERTVVDEAMFASLPARLVETLAPRITEPLITSLWQGLDETLSRTRNLGRVIAELRHRLEYAWGLRTLELPISAVCDAEPFRRLAAELLLRPADTADAYNMALDEYRVAHGITNAAQPLPELTRDDGWTELPLWVWSTSDPIRRALFVRHQDGVVSLSDRAGWQADGPVDADGLVDWLGELRRGGLKIRSRALVTTLYGRLILSDLFLHGIGGAKYDQVTDRFAQRLLGVVPPRHATLTATLRLPITHASPKETDRLAVAKRLRDLRYHGERFVTEDHPERARAARDDKQQWVRQAKTPANAHERHGAITRANEAMHAALGIERLAIESRLAQVTASLRRGEILDSREYSFCLFPEEDLRPRLQRLARPTAT